MTRAQALRCTGGRHALDRALSSGRLRRVVHGAYVVVEPSGPTVDELELRALCVQHLLPPHALVADRCLLWLAGVDVLPPGAPLVEAVVPPGAVVPRRAGLRVRETFLPPEDVGQVRQVRALRPARAVVDLLRRLPLAEAVVVADAVQHAAFLTLPDLRAELPRHAARRGVRQVEVTLELSSAAAESPPESRLRLALVLDGLAPVPQHDVHDATGRWLARVDLAFPELRVAVEYDGHAVHSEREAFARDRQRQNALVQAGWLVLRFTSRDLADPARVVAVVRAALLRAGVALAS